MFPTPGGVSRTLRTIVVLAVLMSSISFSLVAEASSLHRTYRWQYAGRWWSLDFDFPASAYLQQQATARMLNVSDYSRYASDPRDDAVLASFIEKLETLSAELTVWDRLNLVIAIDQSIPYASEPCEYPRYPVEMLVDQHGDCEDAAILTAALVKLLGFDVVLLAYLEEQHMAVGIRVTPPNPSALTAYLWNGHLYYYLEPTSPGWEIGQRPAMYRSDPIVIHLPATLASSSK